MKNLRRRRHLRPRPTRSQIRHQIRHVRSAVPARNPDGSLGLHEAIVLMWDELSCLEVC